MNVDLKLIVQKLLLLSKYYKKNEKHATAEPQAADMDASESAARVFHRRQSRLDVFEQTLAKKSRNHMNSLEPMIVNPAKVELDEKEMIFLVMESRKVFMSQPMLIEIDAPVNLCGDIHAQYNDLIRLFELGGYPPKSNYLFLGDYVDRGDKSLETICLLLAYKLLFPENFFLLRGNHETSSINRVYGFFDKCKRRFNVRLWKLFTDTFNCMPVAAVVGERILCMHGGLSPELHSLEQIRSILRPTDVVDSGLICDLLWADPAEEGKVGWGENDRGVSWVFGADVVGDMVERFDLDLVCRAHQVVNEGYSFFADRHLITVFSAPNYCGEFNNHGAFLCVDNTLTCSITQLSPTYDVGTVY